MRGRYIKAALICGLLGFAGQCFWDFFCWVGYDYRRPHPGTACQYMQTCFESDVAQIVPARQWEIRLVICEGMVLYWFVTRGELIVRTAGLAAFFGVSTMLGADRFRERRPLGEVSV
jgi:hypothetical protein